MASKEKGINKALTFAKTQQAGVPQRPAKVWELIPEERGILLVRLLRDGFLTDAAFGPKMRVKVRMLGKPYRAHGAESCPHGNGADCVCGYWAVRLRTEFGGVSLLYFDTKTQRVSGVLRLVPDSSDPQRSATIPPSDVSAVSCPGIVPPEAA